MKIEELRNKVKLLLEYSKRNGQVYGTIYKEDLDKLNFRVFLKNGDEFYGDDIKQITWSINKDAKSVEGEE